MRWKLTAGALGAALLATTGLAQAAGELNIFNWGNYTNPELITKFEKAHDVKVTVTDYDSNDAALAKIKAGGHGFDIVVPSASFVPVFVGEGLLLEARPDQMENFKHVAAGTTGIAALDLENTTAADLRKAIGAELPGAKVDSLTIPEVFAFSQNYAKLFPGDAFDWVNVDWDPGRRYTAPWQWGSVGMVVDTEVYKGDINTSAVVFDPPAELQGKINVAPEMGDVIGTALLYVGSEPCTTDKEALKKVRDLLMAAKPSWISMDYGITEKMPRGDFAAALYWNGAARRVRLAKPSVKYGYPKEGYPLWMDNVAILSDAKNVDNAKLFMNFIMAPENAALISAFARYANGISGSEAFMPEDMRDAPEVVIPAEFADKGVFLPTCSPEANELYTAIWTELTK